MGFKTIDIINDKGDQSIRIPENMKLKDDKAYLKKIGNSLYIIPYHQPWSDLFDSLEEFSDDFMENRNEPTNQHRDSFE